MSEILRSNSPYIITICSGKGGVGKSILTANLGFWLAQSGKKVLICDADLFFPNQHLLFGVEPITRLQDALNSKISIERTIFPVGDNLSLIAGYPARLNMEKKSEIDFIKLLADIILDSKIDIILIDSSAGASYEVLQCCASSDLCAVVVTDEPTSLLDGYALIKIIRNYVDIDDISLLVNNVIDSEDADDISNKMNLVTNKFLNFEIKPLSFIPYNRIVRKSIIQQELFVKSNPEEDVSQAIAILSDIVLERINSKNY